MAFRLKRILTCLAAVAAAVTLAHAAPRPGQGSWQDTLQARDLDGNFGNGAEAYFDTALNITWLADVNAIAGTVYDTVDPTRLTESRHDGLVSALDAVLWTQHLSAGGVQGWRPPTLKPLSGVDFVYFEKDNGQNRYSGEIDERFNVSSPLSEMGHLAYVTLGMTGAYDVHGAPYGNDEITVQFNSGPFSNMRSDSFYWLSEKYLAHNVTRPGQDYQWGFSPFSGAQGGLRVDGAFATAWAVHSGDVGMAMPVPEPQSGLMMLAGLAAVAWLRRRAAMPSAPDV